MFFACLVSQLPSRERGWGGSDGGRWRRRRRAGSTPDLTGPCAESLERPPASPDREGRSRGLTEHFIPFASIRASCRPWTANPCTYPLHSSTLTFTAAEVTQFSSGPGRTGKPAACWAARLFSHGRPRQANGPLRKVGFVVL